MTCVILAAGYATRMYPLTRDMPKSLLEVAGKTILDYILENLGRAPEIRRLILVSNARFFGSFSAWAKNRTFPFPLHILDDGSTDNDNRLGAVADLAFAVEEAEIRENLLVLAGDNLFDFEIRDFIAFFQTRKADCITTHRLEDPELLRRTGVIEIGPDQRVLAFQEKPREPRSPWAAPPFYVYRRDTLSLIRPYLDQGGNPDAPGHFVPWLLERKPVYAFPFTGTRYDIGSLESYREVDRIFSLRLTHKTDSGYL